MKFFATFLSLLFSVALFAQDLKPLDYASVYQKNHVKSRDNYELKYKGSVVVDSVHLGHEDFNEKGQLIHYTENYSKGKKMAEYQYAYDEKGKLIKNTVSLVFNEWKEMEFKLTYDQAGRVIARELPEPVTSFWVKETYTYNKSGVLIKSEQWYLVDGTLKSMTSQDYPPVIKPLENSLTYIYDHRGLMIMHNKHVDGRVTSARKYHYRS